MGQEIGALTAVSVQLSNQLHWVNTRVTNVAVSIMNTEDVTVVITGIANFQIKIVLDLKGYMKYGKNINSVVDV
jgi:hypothetical protein